MIWTNYYYIEEDGYCYIAFLLKFSDCLVDYIRKDRYEYKYKRVSKLIHFCNIYELHNGIYLYHFPASFLELLGYQQSIRPESSFIKFLEKCRRGLLADIFSRIKASMRRGCLHLFIILKIIRSKWHIEYEACLMIGLNEPVIIVAGEQFLVLLVAFEIPCFIANVKLWNSLLELAIRTVESSSSNTSGLLGIFHLVL